MSSQCSPGLTRTCDFGSPAFSPCTLFSVHTPEARKPCSLGMSSAPFSSLIIRQSKHRAGFSISPSPTSYLPSAFAHPAWMPRGSLASLPFLQPSSRLLQSVTRQSKKLLGFPFHSLVPACRIQKPLKAVQVRARTSPNDAFPSTAAESLNRMHRGSGSEQGFRSPGSEQGSCPGTENVSDLLCNRQEGDESAVSSEGQTEAHAESSEEAHGLCFAAMAVATPKYPNAAAARPPSPGWIFSAVLFVLVSACLFAILRAEQRARAALLVGPGGEKEVETPPEIAAVRRAAGGGNEAFERAKASVAQERLVEKAVAAIRVNDLMRCTAEISLALEENKRARIAIEKDLYEEEELREVYKAALRVWLDGYPPDFGQILQLRNMLQLANEDAEQLEEDIRRQSDVFVI
eukprot:TRINITY_DN33539_c0_g1_i1.p1 TRINITY_DN33539_c0_g1~~TRINITY_DN33539_c0_g1_i1.p1  ORF type:complete len:404 (+),score=52.09 TRINITY_DN33539_c0_g1_i1:209-1420(+)